MEKTLGGDRLGSGKKMTVHLHNYERSTHDLSYLFRSTMSAGTLVPFMKEVGLPGDTFDIDLNCEMMTHPTIGPLFGSYKVQLDVFLAPVRLYIAALHNNTLGIGKQMSNIKLPQIELTATQFGLAGSAGDDGKDMDNKHVNPSSILAYMGIRGIGQPLTGVAADWKRKFNCIPILAYWEIYKNYYANKQEEIGAVIHTPSTALTTGVTNVYKNVAGGVEIPLSPAVDVVQIAAGDNIVVKTNTGTTPNLEDVILQTANGELTLGSISYPGALTVGFDTTAVYSGANTIDIYSYRMRTATDLNQEPPAVVTFPLSNIDLMRENILATFQAPFTMNTADITPYKWIYEQPNGIPNILSSQEGLAVKTYQSDLLNNWLKTENIDAISTATAIDTSGGSFTIDQLILSKKIYNMLNRINVSGGSYDDWMDAVYMHEGFRRSESPMYMGGLIKELVFQEVVSNSATEAEGGQPLGTLAGKGVLAKKHKGGSVVVKVDEPSYIIGLISLTPRIDYSQGNKWDVHLQTMDDFHKPALDEIGFQELITEQMAWWDTKYTGGVWEQKSAGKQPAWVNYMTNINQNYGNFAIRDNEMFMTLNRRYTYGVSGVTPYLKDLTTYIDPSKFNFIFAETAIDAQNFWAQIAVNITARRKMSAKIMPNL